MWKYDSLLKTCQSAPMRRQYLVPGSWNQSGSGWVMKMATKKTKATTEEKTIPVEQVQEIAQQAAENPPAAPTELCATSFI